MKEMMELNLVRGHGNILNSSTINSFNTNEDCMLFDNQEYLEWEHNKLYGYKIKLNEESLNRFNSLKNILTNMGINFIVDDKNNENRFFKN